MFPDQSFLGTILCLENLDDVFFLIKFNSNTLLCNQHAPLRPWSSCPTLAPVHILLPTVLKAMDSMSLILCQPKQWQVVFPLVYLFIFACAFYGIFCVCLKNWNFYTVKFVSLYIFFSGFKVFVWLFGFGSRFLWVILRHPLSWFILFLYISSLRS